MSPIGSDPPLFPIVAFSDDMLYFAFVSSPDLDKSSDVPEPRTPSCRGRTTAVVDVFVPLEAMEPSTLPAKYRHHLTTSSDIPLGVSLRLSLVQPGDASNYTTVDCVEVAMPDLLAQDLNSGALHLPELCGEDARQGPAERGPQEAIRLQPAADFATAVLSSSSPKFRNGGEDCSSQATVGTAVLKYDQPIDGASGRPKWQVFISETDRQNIRSRMVASSVFLVGLAIVAVLVEALRGRAFSSRSR